MKKLWIGFIAVVTISFTILGWSGFKIYQEKPPIPDMVVTTTGTVIVPSGMISEGQNVWQAMGGMELGSIWGHGSYVAPDWTAEWLHRECVFILNQYARTDFDLSYDDLNEEQQAALRQRLKSLLNKNTYDPNTNTLVLDPIRFLAYKSNVAYYVDLFTNGKEEFAIPAGAIKDPERIKKMASFFFWSAWAASTHRVDDNITYTNNWPHEPLIDNKPTSDSIIWTGFSILTLLLGIALLVFYYVRNKDKESIVENLPKEDPLLGFKPTPSQKASILYFWVAAALFLIQMALGVIIAHYGVEGQAFYGIPIAEFLPYAVARTWHTQLGIFWIATSWLASGLFLAPIISGFEPKFQRLGVNVLLGALVVVVLGSMTGEWLSVMGYLDGNMWFYFGHQGYEYVDLGRIWQIALLAGLLIWVFLVGRCIMAAIRKNGPEKNLLTMFLISIVAIGGFYGAGLMWGKNTHLSIVEYWRWWVVHLWVEGFFEVFATAVIAFLFTKLSLLRMKSATNAVLFSTTIFLTGGIIGTLHHLYFAGTPTAIMALGSVFSALEVAPLTIIGFEVWENIRLSRATAWVENYKWPIYFFVAVAFWNMVGAGLFGFMINPPIALYYMQGLNTTAVHAHAALFGVYGMLGLGLMLFCLRVKHVRQVWNQKIIKFAFWAINIGLGMMVLISLLPIGLMQTYASVDKGYWYARSSEFLYSSTIITLKWMRAPGDTIFAIGGLVIVLFIYGLSTGHSLKNKK